MLHLRKASQFKHAHMCVCTYALTHKHKKIQPTNTNFIVRLLDDSMRQLLKL